MAHHFTISRDIQALIAGISFPITTDELADYAKDHGASEEILAQLRFAPGHIFNSFDDINLTYGFMDEFESTGNLWSSPANDDLLAPEEAALNITESDTASP